jgi:Sulfotransferase domain
MIYGIRYVASYLLGTDIAGRNLAVFPDDTFIASYPRSGNTWMRFLIANLMHPEEPVTFANIERVIPDSSALSSRALKRVPRPRLLKSHEYFDPRYQKVIYLVRDPRDVAISLYHFRRKFRTIGDSYPIERYVEDRFLQGDLDVTWGEHVGSWLGARGKHPGFLLVRYEDLLKDPSCELLRAAAFLGIAGGLETVSLAVERSGVDRMRALEKVEHEQWVTTKGKRTDVPFIAAGKSGTWRNLPGPAVALIESAWGGLMKKLGYELSARVGTDTNLATA